MFTIEAASRMLRIDRSRADGLATRYVDGGGNDGLPALWFGGDLRVPRVALRELVTTGQLVQLGFGHPRANSTGPQA